MSLFLFVISLVSLYGGWVLFRKADQEIVREKWLKAFYAYYFVIPIIILSQALENPIVLIEILHRVIGGAFWGSILYHCAFKENGYKFLRVYLWIIPLRMLSMLGSLIDFDPILVVLLIPDAIISIWFWRRSFNLYKLNRKKYIRIVIAD